MKKYKAISITLIILAGFTLLLPALFTLPPLKWLFVAKMELKFKAHMQVDRLNLSWMGPQRLTGVQFSTAQLEGIVPEIVINKPFWAISSLPYDFTVTNGHVQIKGQSISVDQINALVKNNSIEASGITSGGTFSLKGVAQDEENIDLQFTGTAIPTAPVDWLLKTKENLTKIIGPTFSIEASLHNHSDSGNVRLNLTSATSRVFLQGSFTPTAFTLDQPLQATLSIPKELSTSYFQKPTVFWDPITLEINPNGFSCPRDFSLAKLHIGGARINLGRVSTYQPKTMQSLASWLKNSSLSSPNQLDLWLTCCNFSLNEGSLTLGRVDALVAKQLHLCGWGNVNLLTRRVDATLGIPAAILSRSFGIQGLSSNYILQVPVTGTIDDPQVDTSVGGTKVAALIASQVAQSTPSQVGQILGKVTSGITQVAQPPTPPPCQTPFPWEN